MKRRDSEVEAYIFIRDKLEELGWNPSNPARDSKGQVYTQNQSLEHPELQKALGQKMPENVVKLSETKYWVIEAKSKRENIDQAVKEAKDEYASPINDQDTLEATIITGIAGNDTDKYQVENYYLEDGKYEPVKINDEPASALLSPEIVERLIEANSASIRDFPIDEEYFISKAEKINQILHDGSIHKSRRAKVMSALLLSLIESEPDLDTDALTLISDINSRVERALAREGKPEFTEQIKLNKPASQDNYTKFFDAMVRTIRELKDLNIKSAMNSSTDVLGEFYEVFLKYGNGAKEIGIVLTPRHVTNFAADVLGVNRHDIVYDPTCGTGGFLVAAFDKVRQDANPRQLNTFKENKLFGIDQEPGVLSLAIVNMIFRGDGKSNMKEANCFHTHLTETTEEGVETGEYIKSEEDRQPPVSKVLMNPPFSLNNPEEKAHKFVEQALREMEDGGLLFSVVPYPSMVKQSSFKGFREQLLEDHTLLSVISFPGDLFYPIGQETAGIIVKKGHKHPEDQDVLWIRATKDGRVKSKGKRLPDKEEPNHLKEVKPVLKTFVGSPNIDIENRDKLQIACPIDFSDPNLELVPEQYLKEQSIGSNELAQSIDDLLRKHVGFEIREEPRLRQTGFTDEIELNKKDKEDINYDPSTKSFSLSDIFDIETGEYHRVKGLYEGNVPLVSCTTVNNGIKGYYDIPEENTHKEAITVTYDGQPLTAKYHNYRFATYDNVGVLNPKKDYKKATMLFLTVIINREKWRYSYGRKCYRNKIEDVEIDLPIQVDGTINEDYIENIMKKRDKFGFLRE